MQKSKAGITYGDVKSDLIQRTAILIDDKRFDRFTDIVRDYRLLGTSVRDFNAAHLHFERMVQFFHRINLLLSIYKCSIIRKNTIQILTHKVKILVGSAI